MCFHHLSLAVCSRRLLCRFNHRCLHPMHLNPYGGAFAGGIRCVHLTLSLPIRAQLSAHQMLLCSPELRHASSVLRKALVRCLDSEV